MTPSMHLQRNKMPHLRQVGVLAPFHEFEVADLVGFSTSTDIYWSQSSKKKGSKAPDARRRVRKNEVQEPQKTIDGCNLLLKRW